MFVKSEDAEAPLDKLATKIYDIYRIAVEPKEITDLCIKTVRDVGTINEATRRQRTDNVYQGLAQVFSDLCIIAGKCQDHNPANKIPRLLSQNITFSDHIWSRYPGVCPYCCNIPCICPKTSSTHSLIETQQDKRQTSDTILEYYRKKAQRPWSLNQWIKLSRALFGHVVPLLTLEEMIGRLQEETIELLSVVSSVSGLKEDGPKANVISDFSNELADAFMWMCLLAVKLRQSSEAEFPSIVKSTLGKTERGVKRMQDLQESDFEVIAQKGRLLEKEAELTFSMVPDFEVVPNKRTSTGEIDRIIRNESNHPFLRSLGSHILVECKSSKHPISKKEIVDFIDKIESHRCKCGILVTLSRVTGKKNRDASGKIKEAFDRNGTILMTLSVEDLRQIKMGEDPIRIFYKKYEEVQFM